MARVITRLRARLAAPLPYRVVRQRGTTATETCCHRFEWAAEWCARRSTRRAETGVYYVALPAVTAERVTFRPAPLELGPAVTDA
jgi:hypothetical protein